MIRPSVNFSRCSCLESGLLRKGHLHGRLGQHIDQRLTLRILRIIIETTIDIQLTGSQKHDLPIRDLSAAQPSYGRLFSA